jgi:hypothetical protein
MAYRTQTLPVFPADVLDAIGLTGKIVTYLDDQYRVYGVEGATWYVFQHAVGEAIQVDTGMTYASHLETPEVILLPMGAEMGQGRSLPVKINSTWLKRGVCLAKRGPHWGTVAV